MINRYKLARGTTELVTGTSLAILAIITYFPFYFLLISSFKDINQITHNFWTPTLPLNVRNYLVAWWQLKVYFLNTVTVATISVFLVVILSSMAAFAFSRYRFPGKEFLFMSILALLMVPGILTLVPSFIWIRQLGLLNSHWALILPYVANGQVFGIYLMRSFMSTIPVDLFEAAKVDGATMFRTYYSIALPLCKPIISIVAIMRVLYAWNDYIWPLVALPDNTKRTLTVGLQYFQNQFQTNYGPMFAGYVLASLPLLILLMFAMKPFVAGLTSGAIKM